MTDLSTVEAGRRIGVPAHAITAVMEHPGGAGHVVTVNGELLLVSPTVVRRYIPDIDGPLAGDGVPDEQEAAMVEPGPEPDVTPDADPPAPPPAEPAPPVKATPTPATRGVGPRRTGKGQR